MRVMAVDPGKTTGFATIDDGTMSAGQYADPQEFLYRMERWLANSPDGVVVMESYTITAQTLQKTRQHWSLEIIGAARYLAGKYGAEFVLQTPADAKRFVTDDKLKRLGLWQPGEDHARDALRHLVLWLTRSGELPWQ